MLCLDGQVSQEYPKLELNCSYLLSNLYRRCLMAEGFPTSTHVYELDFTYCDRENPSYHLQCLMKFKEYYQSLNWLNRKIFVNEILEEGEHYNFWWMKFVKDEEEYNFFCKNLLLKLNNSIDEFYA